MAITVLDHAGLGSTDQKNVTSRTFDTTAASAILVGITDLPEPTYPLGTLTDLYTNTWNPLTTYQQTTAARCKLWWLAGGNLGTVHTFTYTGTTGCGPCIFVAVLAGTHTSPFDQETGHVQTSGTSNQTGSLTPSENNCIVITMHACSGLNAGTSVDGGFAGDSVNRLGGSHFEGAMAWLIQTTATAANPTWQTPENASAAANLSIFKSAAAGGGGSPSRNLMLLGVG